MSRLARAGGATVASILLIGGFAAPAFAHVSVNPKTATQGGFAALTFRVPTESDTASTTKLSVTFPADQPLRSVSVKPHPGWSYVVAKAKLATPISTEDGQVTEAVSSITWTADSAATAVKPGEFEEFDVSAGPLPKATSMTFKALQTYSDGKVVRWIEESAPGAATRPEHPAPVLTLTEAVAAGASSTGNTATASVAVKAATATPTIAASSSQVRFATGLAAVALLVGVAGGLLGAAALRRRPASALSVETPERVQATAGPM